MSCGFWKPAATRATGNRSGLVIATTNDGDNDEQPVAIPQPKRNISLAQQRMLLPIYKHKRQICYCMEQYGCLVIVGETGSGKSTQIPQYLYEAGWANNGFQIVCTQPRRVAAISLAQRVAQEMGITGDTVGYTIRFDNQTSDTVTRIKYVTDGILLREATLHDPLLSKYSVIICDEAHERTLNTDVLLGLLKKIREKRNDLRVIICSATIDAQAFLDYFVPSNKKNNITNNQTTHNPLEPESQAHTRTLSKKSRWGNKVVVVVEDAAGTSIPILNHNNTRNPIDFGTIVSVDGRQYNVEMFFSQEPVSNYLQATVDTCHHIHKHEGPGNVLCFLPSSEDVDFCIHRMEEMVLDPTDLHSIECLPLYGSLPLSMQSQIFHPTGTNKRRFIFATNLAETSITVPDICFVIDSGLVKLPFYDPITAMERLIVTPISQASARQRAGRGGRVQPGKCFRLYTEDYYTEQLQAQTPPEIVRTNLTSLVLTLKALGVDNTLTFDWMDWPSIESLSHALETLFALGAMDHNTHLTTLGLDLVTFPTEPRIARMLLESLKQKCAWDVLAVASVLQVRDILHRPTGRRQQQQQQMLDYQHAVDEFADPSGDHVTYANLLSQAEDGQWSEEDCREKFVSYTALRRALEIRRQLARFLRRFGSLHSMTIITDGDGSTRSRAIRHCVAAGFFFNIAKLGSNGRYHTLRKNVLVIPSSNSIFSTHGGLMGNEYIVFGETMDGVQGGMELKHVSTVEAKWLKMIAPHYWD